jgi:glyoxylase-like metal-dependent hydrolase (beta-lactamase superfamily II)
MRVIEPGKVCDEIYLLGKPESNVYLLDGKDELAIIGGGIIYIAPLVIKQIQEFGFDPKKIKKAVILHSHFDHVGILPYLKKKWNWIQIYGSKRAKELLSSPKVVKSIQFMNDMMLKRENMEKKAKEIGLDFPSLEVNRVLKDKDILQVGKFNLQVMEVPGHSSCSIALYEPTLKALFASDAGGIPMGENEVFTAANSNFDKYMQSLNKMAELDVTFHLAEHFGAMTGEDAKKFMEKSIQSAEFTRKLLEQTYNETKDISLATEKITDLFLKKLDKKFLPKEVISIVVGQMLKYLAKC